MILKKQLIIALLCISLLITPVVFAVEVEPSYNDEYGFFLQIFHPLPSAVISFMNALDIVNNAFVSNGVTVVDVDENQTQGLFTTDEMVQASTQLANTVYNYDAQYTWRLVYTPPFTFTQSVNGIKLQCAGLDRYKSITATLNGQQYNVVVEGQDGVYEMTCAPVS